MNIFYWVAYGLMTLCAALLWKAYRDMREDRDFYKEWKEDETRNVEKWWERHFDLQQKQCKNEEASAVVYSQLKYGSNRYEVRKGDFTIKVFDTEDIAYNKLCAEELAELINEEI